MKGASYQILDPGLQFFLGLSNRLLRAHDDDDLAVGVILAGEDDPRAGLVSDALDVGTLPADEELVMFGLGSDLGDAAGQLLLVGQVGQHLLRLLSVFLRTADGNLKAKEN